MADTKISAMAAASTLTGTEITPIVQSGLNKQITTANYVAQVLNVNPVLPTQGGTNIISYTLGDTLYASAANTLAKLSGNTTTTQKFLSQTGNGSASAAPVWTALSASSINAAYGSFYQDGSTTLTTPISAGAGAPASIVVGSTSGFPSSGYVLIDNEVFGYTSITNSTTFGGTITRGQLGTSTSAHSAGANATEAQGTGSPTAIGILRYTNTVFNVGVSISGTDNSKIVIANPGIYNVQFSAQGVNYTTAQDNLTIWLVQNGSAVVASAGIVTVSQQKNANTAGATIASWNYLFQTVSANETISFNFSSDSGNTMIATYPAGTSPVHPISPGVILTVNQVA